MDRICEIVVIPDVVADVDALAAARTCAAVSSDEWRATQRIGSPMTEDLGSLTKIPCRGNQKVSVRPGQSGHQRSSN
jgi:hypothetical protein